MTDLQQYIKHAKKFGGYREVWEEAVRDGLPAEQLGSLHLQLSEMSRDFKSGQRHLKETFRIPPGERHALIRRLTEAGKGPEEVARLAGCTRQTVRNALEQGPESQISGG